MGLYLTLALRNLRQGGRRTFLLGGAIAFVTLLLVTLSGLASGLETTLIRSASTLMSGHVNVGGFFKPTRSQVAPVLQGVGALRAQVHATLPDAEIVDRMRGWARLISGRSSFFVALAGVDIAEETRLADVLQVVEGDLDGLKQPGTVALFVRQAARLEVGIGDELTLSAATLGGADNTADLRVVAIIRDVGSLSALSVFVPKQTVRDLYRLEPDTTGAIQIYLDDPEAAVAAMARLRPVLEEAGHRLMKHSPKPFFMKLQEVISEDWAGQQLDLTTWRDEISFMAWIVTGFATLRWLLLSGLLIIIVIGIMNTLWMAIRERRAEIGTVRAIGMSRRQVLGLFLLEATLLGALAAAAGALLGAIAILVVDAVGIPIGQQAFQMVLMSDRLHLELRVVDLLGGVALITVITGLSALYPAWRAARLRPVTAMG
ncbi:MAG: FtsX-like permease family protein [bacterium]